MVSTKAQMLKDTVVAPNKPANRCDEKEAQALPQQTSASMTHIKMEAHRPLRQQDRAEAKGAVPIGDPMNYQHLASPRHRRRRGRKSQ